jgi:hypothetical protein
MKTGTFPLPPLKSPRLLDQVRERIRFLHYSLGTEAKARAFGTLGRRCRAAFTLDCLGRARLAGDLFRPPFGSGHCQLFRRLSLDGRGGRSGIFRGDG